jgi:molecular chaperone GrpE
MANEKDEELSPNKWDALASEENAPQEEHPAIGHPAYEELTAQLTEAEQKAAKYWDDILRLQAEKENLQRRAKLDLEAAHKYSLQKLIQELLPVIDNLERSLVAATSKDAIREGVELTLKSFQDVMNKFGVQEINPEGGVFDPHLHEAVSMQPQPDVPAGTVLSVLQKGYVLHDRLIRPAMVIVVKNS